MLTAPAMSSPLRLPPFSAHTCLVALSFSLSVISASRSLSSLNHVHPYENKTAENTTPAATRSCDILSSSYAPSAMRAPYMSPRLVSPPPMLVLVKRLELERVLVPIMLLLVRDRFPGRRKRAQMVELRQLSQ